MGTSLWSVQLWGRALAPHAEIPCFLSSATPVSLLLFFLSPSLGF